MDKGIILAGNLTVDYLKTVDVYPLEGNLSTIKSTGKSIGGAATNVSIDLAKIDGDLPLKVLGLIGEDEDGDYILSRLKENNIDISYITRDKEASTSFTDVINVEETGNRTFFHHRGANSLLNTKHFNFDNLEGSIMHLGYALLLDSLDEGDPDFGTVMARVLSMAQDSGIKTSLDMISEDSDRYRRLLPHSLPYCNYLIVNELEASMTTSIAIRDGDNKLLLDNMEAMADRLLELGVNDLVVIHAPEGGFAKTSEGDYYRQASLKLPKGYIKGAVGAGDAFCAGILYSLYRELPIDKALKIAVSTAASCLSHLGSVEGMVAYEDILKLYDSMDKQSF